MPLAPDTVMLEGGQLVGHRCSLVFSSRECDYGRHSAPKTMMLGGIQTDGDAADVNFNFLPAFHIKTFADEYNPGG